MCNCCDEGALTPFVPFQELVIFGGSCGNAGFNQDQYVGPFGATYNSHNQNDTYCTAPVAFVAKNMRVEIDTAPGSGKSCSATLYVNGADTALTVSISGASATTGSNTSDTVVINAGDKYTIHQKSDSGATLNHLWFGFVGQP